MRFLALLLVNVAWVQEAASQDGKNNFASPGVPEFGHMLGSLALILVLIYGVSLLLRYLRFGGEGKTNGLAVVTTLSLSPKERLLVIKVGHEQVLVGSSAAGLQTLHRLKTPLSVEEKSGPDKRSFGDLFRGLNGKSTGAS